MGDSPVYFDKSVFRGMDDVLWLIVILWDVPSRNQSGATLAPLGEILKSNKQNDRQILQG